MLSACGVSFYALAFVQAADILSTCGVIWLWDNFSEAITGSLVCRSSLNHSNVHLIVCVDRSVRHFEFPSEHFMYSFPKGLFRDIFFTNFHWNRFIFYRTRAKDKLVPFSETRSYSRSVAVLPETFTEDSSQSQYTKQPSRSYGRRPHNTSISASCLEGKSSSIHDRFSVKSVAWSSPVGL